MAALLSMTFAVLPAAQETPPAPAAETTQQRAEPGAPVAPEPIKPKWNFRWKGWDGLTFGVQAPLMQDDPFKNNLHLDLSQIKFSGKMGWRLGVDAASLGDLAQPDSQNWEVRRVAVYFAGDIVFITPFSYRIDLSILGGHFSSEDTYFRWDRIPYIGSLKIGQYDAPFGLENSMASFSLTFMERPAPVTALAPGRNLGFQIGRSFAHDRATWVLGAFTSPSYQESGDASKDFMRVVGRITGLVVDRPDPEQPEFVHLGLALSNLDSKQSGVQYQTRPEAHLAPYLVDTGHLPNGKAEQIGLEAVWVEGPLSVQAEFMANKVRRETGPPVQFGGFYCQAAYTLTGESRPYDRKDGTLKSLVPFRPLSFKHGGRGAVELAARYSHVDLNDKDVHGGRMNTFTAGANWYFNKNAKVMLNWVRGSVDGPVPYKTINVVEFRIAFNI